MVNFEGGLVEKEPLRLLAESSVMPNVTTLCISGSSYVSLRCRPSVEINCARVPRLGVITLNSINGQLHNASDGESFKGKIVLSKSGELLAPSLGVKPAPTELEILELYLGTEPSLDGLLAGNGSVGDAIDARSLVRLKVVCHVDEDEKQLEKRPVINLGVAFKLKMLHLENAVIDFGGFSRLRLNVLVLRFCTVRNLSAIVLPPETVLEGCFDGIRPIPNQGKHPLA